MRRSAISTLVCAVAWLWAAAACAETARFAVIIGHNRGDADEEPLRHAERDAERVAAVLEQAGQVPAEHIVRLLSKDAALVQRALADVDARIQRHREANPQDETLLFLYYSGHADAGALHLGGTQLSLTDLRAYLSRSAAHLRVVMVDACRSGELTRVKGAKPTAPFKLHELERTESEGVAILTSSSAGEDSQESDRLQGSFFTHHLVAGLLGAADQTGDGLVTLGEAYQYAYDETLRSTSRALQVQHPTYAFQIRGRRDIVVTRPAEAGSFGQLRLDAPGTYMLFERDAGGPLVTEFSVTQAATRLAMRPGAYFLRRRTPDGVWEAPVSVREGQTLAIKSSDLGRVPYAQVARKGVGQEAGGAALSLGAFGGMSAAAVPDTSALMLGGLVLQADLDLVSVQARGRFGRSSAQSALVATTQDTMGLDVAALWYVDVGLWGLGAGGRAGGDWVRQRFASEGRAPDTAAWVWRGGPLARVELAILPWLEVFAEAELQLVRVPLSDVGPLWRPVPAAALGVAAPLW